MPESHDENFIDDKTLEIEAGKAEARELARRLEELKNRKKKRIRQAKSNLETWRIARVTIALALRCNPSLAISWPTHSFFLLYFFIFFSDLKIV